MDILSSEEFTQIYLVTNCFNDHNKVYIGKERSHQQNISKRHYNHKRTFGKQIQFDYIDIIYSWDKKDWCPLESFWIEYFRQLGFDIQNKNNGGGGSNVVSEETKQKISNTSMGKTYSEETKQKMRESRLERIKEFGFGCSRIRPILQYDLEGNFIQEWESGLDYAKKHNLINGTLITFHLKGKTPSAYKSLWRYKTNDYPLNIEPFIKNNFKRSITQCDLKGDYIQEWSSIKEASLKLGFKQQGICNNLSGSVKQAYGFIWKYNN